MNNWLKKGDIYEIHTPLYIRSEMKTYIYLMEKKINHMHR